MTQSDLLFVYSTPSIERISRDETLKKLDRAEEPIAPETLDERFAAFHAANPHVYQRLVALAREAVAHGRKKIGIAQIYEVLRWEHFLATTDEDFRLNNSYRSRYARLIMDCEVDLRGVFETRELHS